MENKLTKTRIVGIVLLLVIGLNALFAGSAFILYPDGSALGVSESLLRHSPFDDFLLPGIVLLAFNGISSIVVAILTVKKTRYYALLITIQGIILMLWLILQMIFIRQANVLHLLMLSCAIVLIIIGEIISAQQLITKR